MDIKITEMSEREKAMPSGEIRELTEADWISNFSSGSLQKAKTLGFSYRNLYLEERTAHDFGWTFRVVPKSRVTFGDAMMEGDNPSLTETCWFSLRMMKRNPFPDSDVYQVKYIMVYDSAGALEAEGVGLILRNTSAKWIPSGNIVYALITEWKDGKWTKAENPF